MPSSLTAGEINLAVGGVLLLISYLIKYQRWTWLISGTTALVSPNDETVPLVGSIIGNISLAIGGTLLLIGIFQFVGVVENLPDWILLVTLLGVTILIAPRLSYNLEHE